MEMDVKKAKKAFKKMKDETKTDSSKVYELGFLLVPSLGNEKVQPEVTKLTDMLSQNGAELIASENPILIDLAYPMLKVIHAHREKCYQGYFGWMKFEIETEAIAEVKKYIDNSESMLRYLLVKTVRENTLLNGKMNLGGEHDKDRKPRKILDEDEEVVIKPEAPEINQEELDKSIDDLVIA